MLKARNRSPRLGLAAVFAAALAACSDATGPTGPFDPVAHQAEVAALSSTVSSNPALQSMSVLGSAMGASFGAVSLSLDPQAADLFNYEVLQARMNALRAATGGTFQLSQVIPDTLWGRVYVYDPASGTYVWDEAQTGPSRGVRLILYAVEFGQVVEPLQPIGHLDLIDQSTFTVDQIRVLAIVNVPEVGPVTFVDYRLSLTATQTSAVVSAVGFISNGEERLDFNVRITISASGSLTLDYQLSAAARGVSVRWVLTFQQDVSGTVTISATFTFWSPRGAAQWTLTIVDDGTTVTLSGEVRWGRTRVLTISGTADAPVFTKADGTELTAEEIQALSDLFEAPEALTALLEGLFAGPAGLFGA